MIKQQDAGALRSRRRARSGRAALMLSAGTLALALAQPALAQVVAPDQLPVNGTFTQGTGTIGSVGSNMTVTQTSDRGVVVWGEFDVGAGASVHFDQLSATSVTINRVSEGGGLSEIYGAITADGIVAILNPNGVIFGGSANINVGGLIASTADIDVGGFMAHGDLLGFTGATGGAINILGGANITIAEAGLAAFVAPTVTNAGVITATGGRVALGAGETFTLDLAGDRLLELGLPSNSPVVYNYGSILADGGRIQLSAAAASAVVGAVINTSGVLQVGAAHEADGVIVLEAVNGDVGVGGAVTGGDVTMSGGHIYGAGEVNTGGSLEVNVNTGAVADTTTGGQNWIADALGLVGTVDGGSTINLGAGVYASGTNVTASNVTIDGHGVAGIVVDGTPLAGLTISGDGVTVRNLSIDGPVEGDHRVVDWGGQLSTVGIVVNNGAENATIAGNSITNIRSGIRLHGIGNAGTEVSNNYIENTKGAILVQYTDGSGLDISGNSQGELGNEWGVVLNLNSGTPLNQHATSAAQANIIGLSDGNNGLTVMDRGYAWSNRSHVWVDGDSTVTPAEDFDYGNGLGNERQALHTVQAGVIAVAAGGRVVVDDGTYVENVRIDKAGISLLSVNGRDATTIQGVAGAGALGTVQITANANDVTLGADGQGFTIIGFDGASPGIETAAVYFQGANSGSTVSGNRITANGENGLLTEYGAVVSGLTIDGNIFDGQTFVGVNPAGSGFGQQFTVPNVPRQLVVIGGGAGGGNTSNVTFTNNQVIGTAGGVNADGQEQGNTLVTIDSVGATITGNIFEGTTTRYGNQLRARGTNTLILGNTFDNANMGAATSPLYVRNSVFGVGQADFAAMIGDNVFRGQGAWADQSATGFHSFTMGIQGAVNEAAAGATVNVLAGTYEGFAVNKDLTILGAGIGETIIAPTVSLATGVGHKYDANMNVVVFVTGADNVVLDGLTIDGNGLNNNAGVFWHNASGEIRNTHITNVRPFSGMQTGQGLAVTSTAGNTVDLTLTDVIFDNWNKNAIDVVTGAGAATGGGDVNLTVLGGSITGRGAQGTNGQNGILLWERAGGAINAVIDGVAIADLEYTGADTSSGILQYGSSNGQLTVRNSTFDNVERYIALTAGSANEVDATEGNVFDGVSVETASLEQLFDIEDRIDHGLDVAGNGLVRVRDGQVYVTQNSGSVQRGVNVASTGDTVNVAAGTFDESVSITRGLTVAGAGMEQTEITGGMLLSGTINDLELSGFTIRGSATGQAVIRGQGATVTGLTIDNVRVDGDFVASRAGIASGHYGGDISITDSEFVNIDHWVVFDTRSGAGGPGAGTDVNSFVFSKNLIDNVQGGITVRQNDGGTGSVTITGNIVRNIGDSSWSSGGVFKVFNAGDVLFDGNHISDVGTNASLTGDGVAYGAALLVRGVDTLTVSNNAFTNVHMAVATEKNGFSAPNLTTFTDNTFNDVGYAFFMPSDALTGGQVVFGAGNAINGAAEQYIVWRGGSLLDLTGVRFNGALGSEMDTADLLALEDMITHGTDVAGAGLAMVNAGNVYVTQGSGSIQRGVDAAGVGFTVTVGDGTFNEHVVLNTADLTLKSANDATSTIIDAGGTGYGIAVSSGHGDLGHLTIDGFTVQNWNQGGIAQGMAAMDLASVDIRNNTVIGPAGGSTAHGNGIQVSGNGSTVTDNTVRGAVLNAADWAGSGILVVNGSNIAVSDNVVSGSDYGIGVQNFGNSTAMTGITISGNTVSGAAWDAITVQAYRGPIGQVSITGNILHGNANGVGVWDYGPGGAANVTISGNDFADNQSHFLSNFNHLTADYVMLGNAFDRTIHAAGGDAIYGDLSFAVSDAAAGSALLLSAHEFVETDQILIDRDLTITGQDGTVVRAGRDFRGANASQAWWLVEQGVNFNLSDLAIDGAGVRLTYGIRNHGHTTIENVDFRNIVDGNRAGIAVGSFGGHVAGGGGAGTYASSTLSVTNSTFTNIGRIGVLIKGDGATADILGNTFTGKGNDDHLDYAVEVGASGAANIIGNTITNNTGVALSDGSTSAGVLVTSFYGGASNVVIENNIITANFAAVALGYGGADVSAVTAFNNDFSGNEVGVNLNSSAVADFSGNWWGTADDAAILAYIAGQADQADFSTFLTSGADTNVAAGFQGDFSDLRVTSLGGQTGTGGRIQEAVEMAWADGVVTVGDGTYGENVLITTADLTLQSATKHGAIIDAGGAGVGIQVRGGYGELGHITIDGFTIRNWDTGGVKQHYTADDLAVLHVLNNRIIGPAGGSSSLGNGIEVSGSGSTVIGNHVTGVSVNRTDWSAAGILVAEGDDIEVRGNTVEDSMIGIAVQNFTHVAPMTGVVIDGNSVLRASLDAIAINGYGGPVGAVTITGNILRGNSNAIGFNSYGGHGGLVGQIDGNDFADNRTHLRGDFSLFTGAELGAILADNDFDRTIRATGGDTIWGDLVYAVGAAATGDELNLSADTFTLTSTLAVDGVSLVGAGSGLTTIDASAVTAYGLYVTGDGVTLSGFTLNGPTAAGAHSYAIKAQAEGGAGARMVDFTASDLVIDGSYRTGLDLHGVVGGLIDGVRVTNTVNGNGIAITDSADVTVRNATTSGNSWGGLALYQKNGAFDQQLTGITVEAGNSFGEAAGLYLQNSSSVFADVGALAIHGFDHVVWENPASRVFQETLADAEAFALTRAATASIEGWNITAGTNAFTVVDGLLIANALRDVRDDGVVTVGDGTYGGFATAFGGPTNVSILGADGAIIDGSGVTGRIVDLRADGTTFSGFTIQGDGTGVAVSVSGRGVTVSDNAISGVLTGVQTTTQFAAGEAVITGNVIDAGYGISLQNTSNTVSDNQVTASVEGVGLLEGANSFSSNTFDIASGGEALSLYGSASADALLATENTVSVAGSGLQGAVRLAGLDGVVNAGFGSYGESVQIGQRLTLNFDQAGVELDDLTLTAGAAGSRLGGHVTASGDIVFAGDVVLTDDTTLIGDTVALAGVEGSSANGQNLTLGAGAISIGSAGLDTALRNLMMFGDATLAGDANAFSFMVSGATTLADDVTITASGPLVMGAVDGAHALSIQAGGPAILGAVGAAQALGSLDVAASTVTTAGATTTGDQTYAGTLTMTGDYAAGGAFSADGDTILGGDVSIDAAAIALGAVDGAHDLTLAADGAVTLGAVGAGEALASLAVGGASITTAGAATTGDQSYAGALTLAGDYAAGGAFSVNGATTLADAVSVDAATITLGAVDGAEDLVLTADGAIKLGAAGANEALASLTASGAAITTAGAATTGDQSYAGALTLAGDYAAGRAFSVNGATTLADAVSVDAATITLGAVDGAEDLVLIADGAIKLGAAGANEALASLTASGAAITTAGAATTGDQSYAGALTLAGDYAAGGAFSVNGGTTLGGDVNIVTQGGDVMLGLIDGAHGLTITAGAGDVVLGPVGTAVAVDDLVVSGGVVTSAGAATTGNQNWTGGQVRLSGAYATGGGDFTVAGPAILNGATTIATSGGAAALGTVNGATAGAQSFRLDAGAGSAELGSLGALARLGDVVVRANSAVLTGDLYAANSLSFMGAGADAVVRLTEVLTTFNTIQSATQAGDISIAPHLIGTVNGQQGVVFLAGTGASAGDGDITLGDAGSEAVRLGLMTATGGDFTAETVMLAGDFTSTLSGNQGFSDDTLDTLGDVVMRVAGNESGPINAGGSVTINAGGSATGAITAGGPVSVTTGGDTNRIITSGGPVVLTSTGGSVGGSVTAAGPVTVNSAGTITGSYDSGGAIILNAGRSIDVQVNGGVVQVNAPGGVVTGVFSEISTDERGTFVINGQTVVGTGNAEARQILIDGFIAPAGGVVGPTGLIQLPVGLALALVSPAGEGEGQRPAVLVNNVDRLGELLRLGYTAIVIQIDESGLFIEEELILADTDQQQAAGLH